MKGWAYYKMIYGPHGIWRYLIETMQRKLFMLLTVRNTKNFLCDSKHYLLCYCCRQLRIGMTFLHFMPTMIVSTKKGKYYITRNSRPKVYRLT